MGEPPNSANGSMLSPQPSMIEAASGEFVDLLWADPATLEIGDIARGLAYACRYGGHVHRYYSVAEHAVLVHDLLRWQGADDAACLGGLFHDAAEAYLGDVVAPLKWAMRQTTTAGRPSAYDLLSERMDDAVARRFGLAREAFDTRELRRADMWAARIEAQTLTVSRGALWRWPGALPLDGALPDTVGWAGGLTPDAALELWLETAGDYGFPSATPTDDAKDGGRRAVG